ncbi:hypothetical protein [Pseudotabrizicola algicola]|uniref:Uncharacterized protein n=1 Tax=Pseudotabrizicola algicola TaxID=2709381 RepID=A0A6B3RNI6_9RHOB|nr:hypothetical protein [Pseudotabrizicola algicola]NEX47620.1 hypothetical protein [Pseudotabrizicola algicola]
MTAWIDELERDLGLTVRLNVIANAGGQRRDIPRPEHSEASALASEIGVDAVRWLAERFAGTKIDIPSARGNEVQRRASLLRAAVLEAGLTNPTRTANDLAREHGVTSMWVRKLRAEMRRDAGFEPLLPLFD